MFKRSFLSAIIGSFLITSCSFNSAFFAVEKQDQNSKITNRNYEDIYVNSADGKKVHCFLFKPDKKPLGTIFFLQGSGDNVASWSTYAEHFVRAGYQVFMMEYRGFGEDMGKATHKNVLKDAENSLIKITGPEFVKGGKIILLGQSYGGQIAINLASKYQDKVEALIIEGTFTSFNKEVVYQVPWIIKPFLMISTSSPYKSKNLIRGIEGIPVLVIHSTEDTTVPFRMGQELYSRANSPKFFWEIEGKHGHGIEDYTEEYLDKIKMLTTNKTEHN